MITGRRNRRCAGLDPLADTRAMFVMLLIADRRVDFSTAWRMSWAETRNHFSELLLLKVVAGLIGSVASICSTSA